MIRSCSFIRRLSATIDLAPTGPSSLASVVKKCASINNTTFMEGRVGKVAFGNKTV